MKITAIYFFCRIMILLFCQGSITKLNVNVVGSWEYQYSLIGVDTTRIEVEQHCPAEKMIFQQCNDKKDLNKMPYFVREQRKGNYLENISCKTFKQDSLIDTYFPVAKKISMQGDTAFTVFNYGCRYKSEYIIEKLNHDTLIIYDNKNYKIANKNFTFVRHVYLKK